ncbi:hypothetical protein DVR12_18375 [Chitinophaga silvatica]|uniref:Uncharacterized protein n=1 Tax=Chitinophaga silvatica TaxID=2282649 RepID=A0A3E1Y700_9BACT|nr:hypothetical protein [Chitinophaga silvatica]RFS20533.1 hypothetical protein DVR12_18375 [Chitinophaga silvatica]
MSFFKNLFDSESKNLIECPRCLGKGQVDQDDIKRLGNELRWRPGRCAYCTGTGKVEAEMLDKVAVDEAYLTTTISSIERKKLINGDLDAIKRGEMFAETMDNFIEEITRLYFEEKMEVDKIVQLYIKGAPKSGFKINASQKAEFVDYIKTVIAHKR